MLRSRRAYGEACGLPASPEDPGKRGISKAAQRRTRGTKRRRIRNRPPMATSMELMEASQSACTLEPLPPVWGNHPGACDGRSPMANPNIMNTKASFEFTPSFKRKPCQRADLLRYPLPPGWIRISGSWPMESTSRTMHESAPCIPHIARQPGCTAIRAPSLRGGQRSPCMGLSTISSTTVRRVIR